MYVELKTNSKVGITEVSVVPMANNMYFIQYLGQSSGQGKMAASLLIHVLGTFKCLHMDSQQNQHFKASKTIIPRSQ